MLLEPGDVDAWASAIDRVTRDEAWARDLACAGLERAKAFTWDATAAPRPGLLRDAIDRRAGRRPLMRIAIDAREIVGKPTGVGRYLSQILSAWAKCRPLPRTSSSCARPKKDSP